MASLPRFLFDLFYPPKCAYCDSILPDTAQLVCPRCDKALRWLSGVGAIQQGEQFSSCISAAWYEDRFRFAILQYKFRGQRHLAELFAPPLAHLITQHFGENYDLLTWLPVSKRRLRERGYDQAYLLCAAVGRILEREPLSLLLHPRPKPPQSGLSSDQARRDNVRGCFTPLSPAMIQGRRILLLDDVITTGATLEEAARTLRAAGARDVVCATICRARPHTPLRTEKPGED